MGREEIVIAGYEPLRRVLTLALILGVLHAVTAAGQEGTSSLPSDEAPRVEPGARARSGGLAELIAELAQVRARAEEWAARAAEYERAQEEAPQRLTVIEREIVQLEASDEFKISARASLAELEVELLGAEQSLSLARQEAAELDAEAARRSERRKRVPELMAAARERLRRLDASPPPTTEADPDTVSAFDELAQARRSALEHEIAAYQSELRSYDARGVLLRKRRDRATLRIAYEQRRAERLRDALKAQQQLEAERQATSALKSLERATALPPAVRENVEAFAQRNAQLARLRTGEDGLVEKIDDVGRKLARADEQLAAVEATLAELTGRIEAAGLSDSLGVLLRRQRSDAPDVGKYRRFIRMRQDRIREVQLEQMELREERQALADVDQVVSSTLAGLSASVPPADRREVEKLLRQLLATRRDYLDAILADYDAYFQKLVDFDAKQQELIAGTEALVRFIDERVLWMPSGTAIPPELVSDGIDALRWLFGPRYWGQLGRGLRDVATSLPLLNAFFLALLAAGLALGRRIRPRIRELGEIAQNPQCVHYGPTLGVLGLTLFVVVWPPVALAYLGWRLGLSPDATQFTRCFAHGILGAALVWLSLRLPRQVLARGGLAQAHLGWPDDAIRKLRRQFFWLTAVSVPAAFLIYVFEMRGEDLWKESIGRLAFLVAMTGAAVFTYWTLREHGGALADILRASGRTWRRPWVWRLTRWVAVAIPVLLGVGALRGYYWTALRLASRYHFTLEFLFLLFVAFALAVRWSLIARRRVAIEQNRRRQEARDEKQRGLPPLGGFEGDLPDIPEEEVDLAAVTAQTSRLLTSTTLFAVVLGLWAIWADVLPAFGILREVELWPTTQTVTVPVTDAAGQQRLTTEQQLVPITLADLLLSFLVALVTLALVRNLPGLLEVLIFGRVGLGQGERYAYITIIKYAITLAGVVLAFRMVGVGWANIQWLVAAVGLGLGFGLQEIFANFVSGLIILFERPVRVGDTVTVGEMSGTVTKVRIRATWITGFDRKELIVPNKEFVTGRLINWSLSDAVLRVDVPVGIAYGSNTGRAVEVLRRVAEENPDVLEDPPPQVLFLGFGDSSLSFELRAFSPDVGHVLPIRHQLHMAIDRAFREAGIEIAFPQRDLHLRSLPADWRAALRPEGEAG